VLASLVSVAVFFGYLAIALGGGVERPQVDVQQVARRRWRDPVAVRP